MRNYGLLIILPLALIGAIFSISDLSCVVENEADKADSILVMKPMTEEIFKKDVVASKRVSDQSIFDSAPMANSGVFHSFLRSNRFFVSIYGGRYTDRHLASKVLMLKPIYYENSWLQVFVVGSTFFESLPYLSLEYELQIGKHVGEQYHEEINIAAILRWHYLPDILGQSISVAVGMGESYATMTPPIEQRSRTNVNATKWLNYLVIEGMISPNLFPTWHLFGRIHHRSGLFGLYNGVRGGSNIMTVGIRHNF